MRSSTLFPLFIGTVFVFILLVHQSSWKLHINSSTVGRYRKIKKNYDWPPGIQEFGEGPCIKLLDLLTDKTYISLILDVEFAEKVLKKDNCTGNDFPSLIALPSFANFSGSQNYMMYDDNKNKDYYVIYDKEFNRALFKYDSTTGSIWREYRNSLFPSNVTKFKESRHEWNETKAIRNMKKLVAHFMAYDMYIFISSGTLLGWYRECGFISFTGDIDFGYREEEWNPEPFGSMVERYDPFPVKFEWGKAGENKEFTLRTTPQIDLFEVYTRNGSSYMSGFDGTTVLRYVFPFVFDAFCSADLHGALFWVTCEPEKVLLTHYGKNYTNPDPEAYYRKNNIMVQYKQFTFEEAPYFIMKYHERLLVEEEQAANKTTS